MHASTLVIWGGALLLYGSFWLWYVGIPRPLSKDEIDAHMAKVAEADLPVDADQRARMRAFLEADDGGEFFMLNLVKVSREKVVAPGTTEPQDARKVLEGYTGHFMPALMRRAGHPAYFGRAAAGYLEQWGVDPDPGWTFGAAIRYRSRRDMIELVNDPRFAGAHAFKQVAMPSTLAFPTAPAFVVVGPKIWVGLAVALLAALAQIGVGAVRG